MGKCETIISNTEAINLIDTHIESFIKNIIKKEDLLYGPIVINNTLRGLQMTRRISHPNAQNTPYCPRLFNFRTSVGYENFCEENTKYTVAMLMKNVYPVTLEVDSQRYTSMNSL